MDADFSHDPALPSRFLKADRGTPTWCSVRATRPGSTSSTGPFPACCFPWGPTCTPGWITGLPLTDSTGGFKCFRREVLEAIALEQVRSNGYAFQIEMSFRAWKKGFRLAEIPIIFHDRVEGQSKMSKRIVREAIWMVWWLRLQGMLGRI